MTDTTATVRKEILEGAKAEIDARIGVLRGERDLAQSEFEELSVQRYLYDAPGLKKLIASYDADIEALQLEKDNLPQVLFSDTADAILPTEDENNLLQQRIDGLAEAQEDVRERQGLWNMGRGA